jgi:ankyrin repeat protein
MAAAGNLNPEVIRVLIRAKADLNARNAKGVTALMIAVDVNKNHEVLKALINAGADVNVKDNTGKTALDYVKTDEVKQLLLNATQQNRKGEN